MLFFFKGRRRENWKRSFIVMGDSNVLLVEQSDPAEAEETVSIMWEVLLRSAK